MKRIICLILAIALVLSLSACKASVGKKPAGESSQTESAATASYEIRLLYSASDSFNPYTAGTEINRRLSLLLFDSLTRLNNNFETEYILAQSVTVEGKICTVKLKNAYFTDGSPVTADDVIYSYNLAKNSATEYAHSLYEVVSVTAADGKTIIFNLSKNDRYFEKLLDFPVLKAGSDKSVDVDGRKLTPIGSGRYVVTGELDSFVANDKHLSGSPKIKKISLVNAPDGEAISHYVEIGATDIYYTDAADANIVRMSGKKSTVNLGNMIYVGINHNYGQLSSPALRQAISAALDRTKICKDAYHNNAVAATGFYNPAVKELLSVQNLGASANTQISIENLEEIGYNKLNSDNMRVNSSGNSVELTLMVNRENQNRVLAAKLISEQLLAVGIKVTVLERSYAEYIEALNSGNFQLYIGEVKTLPNMDLSPLVIAGGSCAYGIKPDEDKKSPDKTEQETEGEESADTEVKPMSSAEIINGYFEGVSTITDVAVSLQTELPVIPVCFRQGLLFHNADIKISGEASVSDIYFSIGQYTVKK